ADVKSARVTWADEFTDRLARVLAGDQELISEVVGRVRNAIQSSELQRARTNPLPTLESYTLLMSAIMLMHRMSPNDFTEAQKLLQTVIDRAPRHPVPRAWMADWYVLRVQQGWTDDATKDRKAALDCSNLALDADPNSSLALAINALVHTHMSKTLDGPRQRYALHLQAHPN